jgi:hypothetical protein
MKSYGSINQIEVEIKKASHIMTTMANESIIEETEGEERGDTFKAKFST